MCMHYENMHYTAGHVHSCIPTTCCLKWHFSVMCAEWSERFSVYTTLRSENKGGTVHPDKGDQLTQPGWRLWDTTPSNSKPIHCTSKNHTTSFSNHNWTKNMYFAMISWNWIHCGLWKFVHQYITLLSRQFVRLTWYCNHHQCLLHHACMGL